MFSQLFLYEPLCMSLRDGVADYSWSDGLALTALLFAPYLKKVSSSINLAVCLASGPAYVKLHLARPVKKMNVQHPTSNFQRPMLMTLLPYVLKMNEK